MKKIHLYSKDDCHLCEVVLSVLQKVQNKIPFELLVTKIFVGHPKYEKYKNEIPLVFIDGELVFKFNIDEEKLCKKLEED